MEGESLSGSRNVRLAQTMNERESSIAQSCHHLGSMPATDARAIFPEATITDVMRAVLNGIITNGKFCMSRVRPLPFVSARPRGTAKVEYPCERNAGVRSSQEETNDKTTMEHSTRQHRDS